jgi:hypothetical protein
LQNRHATQRTLSLLTFVLWLLYRPLTPKAQPAVLLASNPMLEHKSAGEEIA